MCVLVFSLKDFLELYVCAIYYLSIYESVHIFQTILKNTNIILNNLK